MNLSHWFAQAEVTPERVRTYVRDADLSRLRDLGFRHVRLSLDPRLLFGEQRPESLDGTFLRLLDGALDDIRRPDLAVVLDLHPDESFKRRLETEDDFVSRFAIFWNTLAGHVRGRSAEHVFLELLNEPLVANAERWASVQRRLLTAVRSGAPDHTVVVTGYRWSGLDDLVAMTPLGDPNLVYAFHYYEPHAFTHQGATWGDERMRHLGGLPYPSSPEAVTGALQRIADQRGRELVEQYGREGWAIARIEARILRAARWGEQHGVALVCNEFGVYRSAAPREARLAWLADVRTALERAGIGWTHWDYAGGFGLVHEDGGARVVDEGVRRSLGL